MRSTFRIALFAAGALLLLWLPATEADAAHRPRVSVWIHGGPWYPWPGPYYHPPYYGPPTYVPAYVRDWAAIDTDIAPGDAEVWLDGEMIGTVDDFDGWPAYLEVEPGEHRLEFRLAGYRTLRIDLDARPGRLYRLKRRLREGSDPAPIREPAVEPQGRGREPAERESPGGILREEEIGPERRTEPRETRPARARLVLSIAPPDAVVYLDGRLLGVASELDPLGMLVAPGEHRIEIVRAGREPWSATVLLEPGDRRRISASLRPRSGAEAEEPEED